MIKVKKVEVKCPPIMVQPIGAHKEPPDRFKGKRPPTVVKVVNKMGKALISPASFKAERRSLPACRNWLV